MASNLKFPLAEFCMKMSELVTLQDIILLSCALAFIPLPRLAFRCSEISFCLFGWVEVIQINFSM